MSTATWRQRLCSLLPRMLGALVLLVGAFLALGGGYLMLLGGSFYFLPAGLAWLVAGVLIWRRNASGVLLAVVWLAVTAGWAMLESDVAFWPLFSRLLLPALVAFAALLVLPCFPAWAHRTTKILGGTGAGLLFCVLLGTLYQVFQPHGVISSGEAATAGRSLPSAASSEWRFYGKDTRGSRFSEATQITRENVSDLQVAWTFRTGDIGPGEEQNVPLFVDGLLYTCSRSNRVAALDGDTGRIVWAHDPKAASPVWQRCRGLGYYQVPDDAPPSLCHRRIVLTTIDARLLTLDAKSGALCTDFGSNGTVDLKAGMGEVKPGFYFQTSAPLVARDRIIIGGWVRDNQETGEPSGVIRAFDVITGKLAWAWDLGMPEGQAPGSAYTRGTPNMWSTASFDEELGLVYLPMGNATPDYFGATRSKLAEKYASSVVALDINTGKPAWNFQTAHHDIWDYDVSSQPALVDLDEVKALVQATKSGQLYLLDRASGKPLTDVEERPVPQQGAVPEEWLSPTQPFSVGMPSIGTERLSESRMWGITLLDQLYCRIQFRKHRYEGPFTPPGTSASIEYPGNYGGMNWGGTSYDGQTRTLYVNDIRMPVSVRLLSHEEADAIIASRKGAAPNRHGPAPQRGTPYGVLVQPFMSPLGVPCSQPPFGTLTAVSLATRKILWQVPAGTVQDTGPLGLKVGLRVPIGMPTISGSMATASGLLFFAGTQDYYLRAFNSDTGTELWRSRLPVGSSATPMTYVSPTTKKQYVVISAGGAPSSPDRGDFVVAYRLP